MQNREPGGSVREQSSCCKPARSRGGRHQFGVEDGEGLPAEIRNCGSEYIALGGWGVVLLDTGLTFVNRINIGVHRKSSIRRLRYRGGAPRGPVASSAFC